MFLIVIDTVSSEVLAAFLDHRQKLRHTTVVEAAAVAEACSLGLREGRLALHFSPQGQNLCLIVEHALLVHIFQPQFLHTSTTGGILHKTAKTQLTAQSGRR